MTWLKGLHYSRKKMFLSCHGGGKKSLQCLNAFFTAELCQMELSMVGHPDFVIFPPISLKHHPPLLFHEWYQWKKWLFWLTIATKDSLSKKQYFKNFIVVTGGHVLLVAPSVSVSRVCAYQMWSITLCVVMTEFSQKHANGDGPRLL